jgi:N6-adenosine-specific RNA methylase IME4
MTPALPPGPFSCILADPAWRHVSRSPKGQTRRSPSHHYATMPIDEIKALPVKAVAAKNAHLFLWTTWPHLPQALDVMKAWGFTYSSGFLTWVKLNPRSADEMFLVPGHFHVGMGYTSRKNSEILLLGRRGAPKRLSKSVRELMIAARREHSRKPDETFARIEAYCEGPRLEMFSRQSRPGWTTWGNEAAKFDQVAA